MHYFSEKENPFKERDNWASSPSCRLQYQYLACHHHPWGDQTYFSLWVSQKRRRRWDKGQRSHGIIQFSGNATAEIRGRSQRTHQSTPSITQNQQQLKIYCDDLEEKNKELLKSNEDLLKNTKHIITTLKRDNQRLIEDNQRLRERQKEVANNIK